MAVYLPAGPRGGVATFYVGDYGPVGSTVDITAATQAAVNALRASGVPAGKLVLAPGIITTSIDCTNIGAAGVSLNIEGAGRGATHIAANLGAAFPVFDLSGSGRAVLRDFWVTGQAGGLQTAAFRFARTVDHGYGDNPLMDNVMVDGTFAQCSVAAICDLIDFRHSTFSSPTAPVAVFFGPTDQLGVGSAYSTLGTPVTTMGQINACTMLSSARCGILAAGFADLFITGGTYCNLQGTATQAIELSGSGNKAVWADIRVESNGATGSTSILFIPAGGSMIGGRLEGVWALAGAASTIVSFGDTTATLFNCEIHPSNIGGGVNYFSPNGGFYNCTLWNHNNLPPGDASHNFPSANRVFHRNNGTPWTFQADGINTQWVGTGLSTGHAAGLNGAITTGLGGVALNNGVNRMTMGSGAPGTPGGFAPAAGDVYFRIDTPGTANQRVYVCTTGGGSPVWAGIV